jgi:YggT family protein
MVALLFLILSVLRWIIIVDAIASWFRAPDQFPRNLTNQITEPLYAPIRKVLGGKGGMDFSPLIMLLLLHLGQAMLGRAG